VAVDVRSPETGVLTALHAAVGDTVAVGAPLFTIDVGATAAAGGGAAAPAPAAAAAAAVPAAPPRAPQPPPPPPQQQQQHARKPSIAFRHGVRPVAPAAAGHSAGSAAPSSDYAAELAAQYPSKPGAKPELSVPPSFGRPPIGAEEAFLIDSGGAYGAPLPPPPKKGK
jgi:pyruvate dehydrogenase E2 component (dihydrolipoamide acetyltransferase)